MKLLEVFNDSYYQFFVLLAKSFCSPNRQEDQLLQKEVKDIKQALETDPFTRKYFTTFDTETKKYIDDIFNKDDSFITQNKLPIFRRLQFLNVWQRMVDEEKAVFWDNLISLIRYNSMINACGSQLAPMEQMAMQFMQKKQHIDPKQYHQELFTELLAGGEMSQQLMKAFQDPNCLKNILQNVGTIIRQPKGQTNATSNNFADILNMTSLMASDEKQMQKIQDEVLTTMSSKIN